MSSFLELALGVMTALGGFVDISELVFTVESGSRFGYHLLWVVIAGTLGIMLYGEMSGRIAAVLRKPTFEIIRERLGKRVGLGVLIASNLVNLLTCAAEVGGIAIVLQLLFGGDYRLMLVASGGLLLVSVYLLRFKWIERVFGLGGLALLVYVGAAVTLQPNWSDVAKGLIPNLPAGDESFTTYAYFAVGLFSSILMPYEVYFYSSGGIEDRWTEKDLPVNIVTSTIGFALGALLSMSLIVAGAVVFEPRHIDPSVLGTSALPAALAYGVTGLLFAFLGMLFAIGGAAVETALAGAYNIAQFFGRPWGKDKPPREVLLFTVTWMAMIIAGFAIAMSGLNPLKIVEFSVVFAVVVLPFTYYPILVLAKDKAVMGKHANRPWMTALGWIYFALIVVAALGAIPLMVATNMGQR